MGWVPGWKDRPPLPERKSSPRMKKIHDLKFVADNKKGSILGGRLRKKNSGLYALQVPHYEEVASAIKRGKTLKDLERGWSSNFMNVDSVTNAALPSRTGLIKNNKTIVEEKVHTTRASPRVGGRVSKLERGWAYSYRVERRVPDFQPVKPVEKTKVEIKREKVAKKLERGWVGNFVNV
jgi:hypothetical protein